MEQITKIVQEISSFLWGWPMIVLLLGTHLYLTVRLRFPQLHILKALRLSVSKDREAGGDVSQFGALATSLAATIGTGNIIGVATAVALGGPGAVFWCWLTGVFGMSTKYAEGLLAVKYRVKNASGSGFVGTTVMMAARYGIARGLFSNESGLGSAPIVAAAAQTRNPVRQALVSSTGTFWDTVVICALTGLVLVSSILAYPDIDYTSDAALTKMAFAKIPYVGTPILSFGIVTFAFSTILGWTYYSQKAVEYLGGRKIMRAYRLLWIVMVYVGSVVNLSLVWNFADVVNALMAIPNLISLLLLSGVIVSETRKYLWNDRLNDYHEE